MFHFKNSYERELDRIIADINMNMSNNYKDNAQMDLKKLENTYAKFVEEGKIKEKGIELYSRIISEYQSRLKGYTHKDQKPYWT